MTNEEQLLRRALDDFLWYAPNFLKVKDKQTLRLVPLVLKPVQVRLAERIIADLVAGVPVRVIVLKARREGVSTVTQAIFFWLASLRRHQVGVTLSHHDQTTGELFGITETFYRNVPDILRPRKRQSRRGNTLEFANPSKIDEEVRREPGLESVLRTVTAKNAGAGQGANLVHVSELGLYELNQIDAESVMNTLLQIVPTAPGTIIVIESTARGLGNEFHRRWKQAERGEGSFTPFFLAWFDEPTNIVSGADWESLGELDDRELRLKDRYGCSAEQIAWRRMAMRDLVSDPDAFDQEYPESADVAFLSSGRPYFDQESVQDHLDWAQEQPLLTVGDVVEDDDRVTFRPTRRGRLTVWEVPQPGEDYLIAVDSSEGSEHGDPQHAYVYKRSRLQIVAAWHGRVDRDELGDHMFLLGKLYNEALIAAETNGGWGWTVIAVLRRRGYWRLYRDPGQNKVRKRRSQSYGFDMSPTKRPVVLDTLGEAIRDGALDCPDPELFKECLVFVYGPTGKPAAMPGEHDDRVMAAALGAHLWTTEARRVRDPKPQPPRRVISTAVGY